MSETSADAPALSLPQQHNDGRNWAAAPLLLLPISRQCLGRLHSLVNKGTGLKVRYTPCRKARREVWREESSLKKEKVKPECWVPPVILG